MPSRGQIIGLGSGGGPGLGDRDFMIGRREMLHRASVHEPDVAPSALPRIGKRFGNWPAIVFALLSLSFGSAIIVANPPLRGPDEISHFSAHLFLHAGRASAGRRNRRSQGSLRGACAL